MLLECGLKRGMEAQKSLSVIWRKYGRINGISSKDSDHEYDCFQAVFRSFPLYPSPPSPPRANSLEIMVLSACYREQLLRFHEIVCLEKRIWRIIKNAG